MPKLISVIIPVYNHAYTLAECLELLSYQIYKNFEIIIINDGSTDNFELTMNNIFHCHSERSAAEPKNPLTRATRIPYDNDFLQRIKIINQNNQGAAAARNRGFKEAKGEYVIFWDADTMANPDLLAKMAKILDKNPDKSYVYGDFRFGKKLMRARPFDLQALKQNNYIDTTSLMRREDFPGFDESLKRFQDWDLWLTMSEKNKTGVYLPELLYAKHVKGRAGISNWLPKFWYKFPFKTKKVKNYEAAKQIVLKKHHLDI